MVMRNAYRKNKPCQDHLFLTILFSQRISSRAPRVLDDLSHRLIVFHAWKKGWLSQRTMNTDVAQLVTSTHRGQAYFEKGLIVPKKNDGLLPSLSHRLTEGKLILVKRVSSFRRKMTVHAPMLWTLSRSHGHVSLPSKALTFLLW